MVTNTDRGKPFEQKVKPGSLLEFTAQQLLHVVEATTEDQNCLIGLENPFHSRSCKPCKFLHKWLKSI
jgi:hypothetical protein